MLHFVHVFTPLTDCKAGLDEQKPFFGPDELPIAGRRDDCTRRGPGPEVRDATDSAETNPRFVALLSVPFL